MVRASFVRMLMMMMSFLLYFVCLLKFVSRVFLYVVFVCWSMYFFVDCVKCVLNVVFRKKFVV